MIDKWFCFYRRFSDWNKIEMVKQLISQYEFENKKVADEIKEFISEDDKEIKNMMFKNPNPCFVGDIKILYGVDVNLCLGSES